MSPNSLLHKQIMIWICDGLLLCIKNGIHLVHKTTLIGNKQKRAYTICLYFFGDEEINFYHGVKKKNVKPSGPRLLMIIKINRKHL